MTIEQMKERKKELGYSYEQIAKCSGIPLSTVQKVLSGATQSPRYDTLYAIQKVLTEVPASLVREAAWVYGQNTTVKKGEYTVEDYYNWPEDERIELIDGQIFKMEAPYVTHQYAVLELASSIREYIRKKRGKCFVVISPIDVQLDKDERTMVQPDVIVICKKDIITEKNIYGAPDMIVEVLSDSTRQKDMSIKLTKYNNAKVREYWMIDIKNERVIVYDLEHNMEISLYTFDQLVPVHIFDGECQIDFTEIRDYLRELKTQTAVNEEE